MKYLINGTKIVAMLSLVVATGCTDNFTDYNTNPENVTEDMLDYDNSRVGAPFRQIIRNILPTYQTNYGSDNYQVIEDLAGNAFAGYTSPTNSGFRANNLYDITASGWYNSMFNAAYTRVINPWNTINAYRDQGLQNELAIADIAKVACLHRVADTYGPIPYSTVGSGNLKNSYDSQQEVYKAFFKELDAAITTLTGFVTSQPGVKLLEKYDWVYSGDVTKWVKFANTLRLRLAMRVAYADPALAKEQAEAAVANSVGLMTETSDIAQVVRPSGVAWEYPPYIIQYNFNDAALGATIESYMNGYNDPRREKYFAAGSDGGYHGVRMGIALSAEYKNSSLISKMKCTNSDPLVIMTPAEAYFLRAEGALRGWNMGGTAQELYEQGIRSSFSTWGASGVDDYIADDTSKPGDYVDVVNSSNNSTALSSVTVKWDENADFETKLEKIITQKYIAIYPLGQEAWSEFRRTGYPKVFPVLVNNSGGAINTDKQIRRLNFPSDEYKTNDENVQKAISILNSESNAANGDNGGTNLWWDKK
jgi:hypothetical protein